MDEQLAEQVRARAGGLCEYCHLADEHSDAPFEVDHIIARQHHGKTILSNLAWAVMPVRLFHPRRHKWSRHFRWQGPLLVAKTAIGRATVEVLNINHPDRVRVREVLLEAGLFSPA